MTKESALSRAKELKNKAEEVPDQVSQEEMEELVETAQGNYQEARTAAAGAIDQLYTRPELFEPVLEELIEYSAYHPHGVEGIPAQVDIMHNEDLREVIFISDAVARVAQRRPELLVPHTDQLIDIIMSDRNYPKYHLFTLGMAGGADPNAVPLDEVQSRICSYLDTNAWGYAGWAADTLRRIGDPSVLPELRENEPKDPSEARDEAEIESFQEAIEELERVSGDY